MAMGPDVAVQNSINTVIGNLLSNIILLDSKITLFINQTLANPVLDFLMPFTHNLPYFIFAISVVYFLAKKEKKLVGMLLAGLVISILLVTLIKFAVDRPRPFEVHDDIRMLVDSESSASFPSNHAQTTFLLGTIVSRFHPYLALVIYAIALLVSFGRVYLGVHYVLDVIGGAMIGILIGWIILRFPSDARKFKAFVQSFLKPKKDSGLPLP